MAQAKCPDCRCEVFYIKNPEDSRDVYEFKCRDGEITFQPGFDGDGRPETNDMTEAYCRLCGWHDKLKKLKR